MNAQLPVAAPSSPTIGGVRLINRVDVLQELLAAVAAVPEGVKLSIPQLRDALISQGDVLGGLQTLVLAGEIDPATLRPHKQQPECASPRSNGQAKSAEEPVAQPPSPPAPSGAELAARLTEYCAEYGLAQHRVFKHLGLPSFVALRRRRLQPKTISKIEAFLAAAPPPGLELRKSGGPRVAANGGITGASLAAELDALIEQHGLSKCRVGTHIYGSRHGVDVLRRSRPRVGTVAKVRALLADPPIEELKPRDRWATRRANRAARDAVNKINECAVVAATGNRLQPREVGGGAARTGPPPPAPVILVPAPIPANRGATLAGEPIHANRGSPEKEPLSFEEQLARVERGEVGIGPNLKFGRPDPSGTLGGVTGEINL